MNYHPKHTSNSSAAVWIGAGVLAAVAIGAIIFIIVTLHSPMTKEEARAKAGIVYDSSATEGGWDNLSPEEIAEKLNEKVAEGMINISMNTAPYFEDGKAEGNVMIVNEAINNYPSRWSSSATTPANRSTRAKRSPWAAKSNVLPSMWSFRLAHTNARLCSTTLIRSVAKSSAQPVLSSTLPSKTDYQK